MPSLGWWKRHPGPGVGRCEAASGSQIACAGCVGTVPPEYRGHPSRSDLARGQRGNPDGVRGGLGGPTVRKAHSPSGRRMTQQANAGALKGDRTQEPQQPLLLAVACGELAGYGAWCPGPKGRPRGSGEPVESAVTTTREPRDKLDAPAAAGANGPKDEALDWDAVDWRRVEGDVRRLRQRIFTASRNGDLKKVRNLQKLMLRSRANALVAVRRVTEVNAGRVTAGIDGMTALLPQAKAELADWAQRRRAGWNPWPVKRAWVPKSGGRQRPLGIPVLRDRALQAAVLGALEPEWEARFEPKSYGFRPGRSCHDAIEAVFRTSKGRNPGRKWALDADLEAAFDRIDHSYLLVQLGSFPARGLVAQWLKAGVIDKGRFAPTLEGTPQGGIISPVLMNIALHGMEQAAGVRYLTTGTHAGETAPGSPVLIRYADDRAPRTLKEVRCRRRYRRMRCCTRDEGAGRLGWWPFAVALQGEAANHREVRRSRAGVLSLRRWRAVSASGVDHEGERKRTTDEASKAYGWHRNRGRVVAPR